MKKSELKDYIKEQISDILSMDEMEKIKPEDVENLEKYNDALKVKKSLEKMEEDEDASDAVDYDDYVDIGKGYLDGFRKPHSLNDDQLEALGRKVTKQLYKGDIDKAYQDLVLRTRLKEDEDDAPAGDKDVDTKARGNDKIIKDFRRIQKQMQTHLQMFKDAEGADAKKAAKQMLVKLTPEFQAAKKKYDKIANI